METTDELFIYDNNEENKQVKSFFDHYLGEMPEKEHIGNELSLKREIEKDEDIQLSVVSAYFSVWGYSLLKNHLKKINKFRFIFGDPNNVNKVNPELNPIMIFEIAGNKIKLSNDQQLVSKSVKECLGWLRNKDVEIKTVKNRLIHGKLYHLNKNVFNQQVALVGSSNFTKNGLGGSIGSSNIELNVVIKDQQAQELLKWLNNLWSNQNLVKDAKDEVIETLNKLYTYESPEFIYFLTLYYLFKDQIDEFKQQQFILEQNKNFLNTQIWKSLYDFQKDAVRGLIYKINKYNGAFLADSVGLGKTYVALAVIKHYELIGNKVLVLCPKKLEHNWNLFKQNYTDNPLIEDRFTYDLLFHTDMSRDKGRSGNIDIENVNWSDYDLVVIDESHNFRNVSSKRYQKLLGEVFKKGRNTKVLLLSATPVNISLNDLTNQIHFITKENVNFFKDKDNIYIADYKQLLNKTQSEIEKSIYSKNSQSIKIRPEALPSDFLKLIDELIIARSRKLIKDHYKTNTQFPNRLSVVSRYINVGLNISKICDDIDKLELAIYKPNTYLDKKCKTTKSRGKEAYEDNISGLLRTIILKRLESSIISYKNTLDGIRDKINDFLNIAKQTQKAKRKNIPIDYSIFDEEEIEYIPDRFDINKTDWKALTVDLKMDLKIINNLISDANEVIQKQKDKKLETLIDDINCKIKNCSIKIDKNNEQRINENNKKVIIFTAFADTAKYLYDEVIKKVKNINAGLVTGQMVDTNVPRIKKDFNAILSHFSPKSKRLEDTQNEIDVLIATDCISEGQNLQDCDMVINYDIHWNPVRIIQRFGRIDRIQSTNQNIQMVNYWPGQLDDYLKLTDRVYKRMYLTEITGSGDTMLTAVDHQLIKIREAQLKKLSTTVLESEKVSETLDITQFTLDDFRLDLLNYFDTNKEKVDSAPLGMLGITNTLSQHGNEQINTKIQEGIIFVLRQKLEGIDQMNELEKKRNTQALNALNPLNPFYLVYIPFNYSDCNNVKISMVEPKSILKIFRDTCLNKKQIIKNLVDEFEKCTNNAKDMDVYNIYFDRAMKCLEEKFQDKLKPGSGMTPPHEKLQIDASKIDEKFELISWLIITNNIKCQQYENSIK